MFVEGLDDARRDLMIGGDVGDEGNVGALLAAHDGDEPHHWH
jgi:hypothetical protein